MPTSSYSSLIKKGKPDKVTCLKNESVIQIEFDENDMDGIGAFVYLSANNIQIKNDENYNKYYVRLLPDSSEHVDP